MLDLSQADAVVGVKLRFEYGSMDSVPSDFVVKLKGAYSDLTRGELGLDATSVVSLVPGSVVSQVCVHEMDDAESELGFNV